MEILAFKMKLVVLWLFTLLVSFHPIYFIEPGVLEETVSGTVEGVEVGAGVMLAFSSMYLAHSSWLSSA